MSCIIGGLSNGTLGYSEKGWEWPDNMDNQDPATHFLLTHIKRPGPPMHSQRAKSFGNLESHLWSSFSMVP